MLGAARRLLRQSIPTECRWIRRSGWLGTHLPDALPKAPQKRRIEALARATNALGAQPLAAIYGEPDGVRTPAVVRASADAGDLYAWLASRAPQTVVEFGSAFGVSGMYFGAGIEALGAGHLYSFELNPAWAAIAATNIQAITSRVTLTQAAVEDSLDRVVPVPIDLVLVDGVHSDEFVRRHFELLAPRMASGGVLIFDDIDFPKPGARMREAWQMIATDPRVVAAVEVFGRLGLVELA